METTLKERSRHEAARPATTDAGGNGNGHGDGVGTAALTDALAVLTPAGTTAASRGAKNPGSAPVIRGVGIRKRYVMGEDNYVDALQDASLEIRPGEVVGIMGPSGSGKSTLLHILGCLDSANSGEVWLDGRRVDSLSRRDLARLRRNEVGFIFQTFNLVPSFTALENVMLAAEYAGKGRREAREAARNALAQVGLADREDHRPTELSGGQQQRVAIARALVNSPKVIFGDEPTGNLDSASSAEVVEMMHHINRETGTTFVLVTHDPGVAATCDRVFHMLDGRVTNGHH
jgi:putative ABC transport system ATP-binding protein